MSNVIKIKRGQESQLPTLQQGELALTTDSNKLFVGGLGGNVQLNPDSTENLSLSAISEGTEVAIGISNNGSLITSTEFDVAENLADVATSGSYNDLLNKPQLEVNAYRLELTGMIPEIPANNTALKNTLSKMVSDYDNGIQSVLVVYPRGMMSSYNSSDCGIYYLRNLQLSGSRGFNLENNTPSMIVQENYDEGYTEIVKKTTNLSVSCPNGSSTVSSYTISRNSEVQAKVCSIDETYIATYTPTKNSDPATKKYVDDSIPTNVSSFTNDAGYLTSIPNASSTTVGGVKCDIINGVLYITNDGSTPGPNVSSS